MFRQFQKTKKSWTWFCLKRLSFISIAPKLFFWDKELKCRVMSSGKLSDFMLAFLNSGFLIALTHKGQTCDALRDCPDIHSFFHFIQRVLAAWSLLWQLTFLFSCAISVWIVACFFHFVIMEQSTAPRKTSSFTNHFITFSIIIFLLQTTSSKDTTAVVAGLEDSWTNLIWCLSYCTKQM